MMKPTVLVVDDDEGIRQLLQEALEKEYRFLPAVSGYHGFATVMKKKPRIDVIVTDLMMPGLDGVQFGEYLREDVSEEIPLIVISGYLHLPEYQKALRHLNPVAALKKPFHLKQLRETIRQALEQRCLAYG